MKPKDALSMLDRCHRQLEKRMKILVEAADALASGSGGPADCDAIVDVLDFLDRSDARHVADEEESIFPRLAASERATLEEIAGVMEMLDAQHRAHDELHAEIRAEIDSWTERPPAPERAARVSELSRQLDQAYREHIAIEDDKLAPAMKILLGPAELEEIFEEMQTRRPDRKERDRDSKRR